MTKELSWGGGQYLENMKKPTSLNPFKGVKREYKAGPYAVYRGETITQTEAGAEVSRVPSAVVAGPGVKPELHFLWQDLAIAKAVCRALNQAYEAELLP